MMDTTSINAQRKAGLDPWFDMADQALDETEKLMDLHMQACRESIHELARCCQSACDVRDMPGALSWQAGAIKPFAERSVEYGARLMGLASGSGLEWGRSLEAQWERMGRQMSAWMTQMGQPLTPAAGEPLDYLRNSMRAFDGIWDAMRQNLVQAQQQGMPHKVVGHKGQSRKA